jgi:hypothetical protein
MGKTSVNQVKEVSDWLNEKPVGHKQVFRKRDIKKMIAIWQERLELQDIAIHFDPESEPHHDGNASIWMSDDYHYGVLRLRSGWAHTPAWHVNQKILHELCHLRLKPLDRIAEQSFEYLAPDLKTWVEAQYRSAREGVVEHLANTYLDAYGPIKGSA